MEYGHYHHPQPELNFSAPISIPSTFPADHSQPFQAIDSAAMGTFAGGYDDRQGYHGYSMSNGEEGGDATKGPRLTQEQLAYLEGEFIQMHKPNTEYKKALADKMGVEASKVNNWFQNRRAKAKHEGHAQKRSERSFQDAGHPFYSVPLEHRRISESQNSTYYSSPEQAPVISDDLGGLVDFGCLDNISPPFYIEQTIVPAHQSFDSSITIQPELPNIVTANPYPQWPSNELCGDHKVPSSSVREIDSMAMLSASPSVHPSCVEIGLNNTQWGAPPMYQNIAGGLFGGNPSSQSFDTSPSDEGEQPNFITPPQETSPLPGAGQGPFQHDRHASSSSKLAENLDVVHLQQSHSNISHDATQTNASAPKAPTTTGLPTPEVSPDSVAPKLPFSSSKDLATRRKRQRPADLQPESNRSASYAGPMTNSPHLRTSPLSGKSSPVRRIRSTGRIQKPGTTTAHKSPRNLESCFKVAAMPQTQPKAEHHADNRHDSGTYDNSIIAPSPQSFPKLRQETWSEPPSHNTLPSSSWDNSVPSTLPSTHSPPESSWQGGPPDQAVMGLAMAPSHPTNYPLYSQPYPPQSAPSYITTFGVPYMSDGCEIPWSRPGFQHESYRDDTQLPMPFRPNHLQHHSHSGPVNYYSPSGHPFQHYPANMGAFLSYQPFQTRTPTPPHKALDIKVETGPPPPKELAQTTQEQKEYTFENSFAGDAHFLTGSKK